MTPDQRAHIEALLADERLSFRAIADLVGCSDWTIRKIARELTGDERPMKSCRSQTGINGDQRDPATPGWAFVVIFGAGLAVLTWLAVRCGISPTDFGQYPTN